MSNEPTTQRLTIGPRAAQSVIEHVAGAIEHELPMYRIELVSSTPAGPFNREPERLYRISHPTVGTEPVYILTTVRVLTPEQAREYMTGGV